MFELELLGTVITEEIEELIEKYDDLPGYDFNSEEIKVYAITFYSIDNISPFIISGFSLVSSGGFEYIVFEDYSKLKEDIKKSRLTNFN